MPSRLGAVDVGAVDADMLFGDAAETLRTGVESVFLDAIDAGTVAAVMSDRAFHELGWMSARAARGHAVDHDALRSTITAEYLPRIPVAVVPEPPPASGPEARGVAEHSTAWMPDASDIKDPKDVPHGQLARLVLATVVFSHDKDLRKPGYAPRFRRDFDERLGHLETITAQRTFEDRTGFALAGLGSALNFVVSRATSRVGVGATVGWLATGVLAAVGTYALVSEPERRGRIVNVLTPIARNVVERSQAATTARRHLTGTPLVQLGDFDRLEVRLASYLIRNPDMNMTDLTNALDLTEGERAQLGYVLREHSAFERSSRHGWSVGRVRLALETVPRGTSSPA